MSCAFSEWEITVGLLDAPSIHCLLLSSARPRWSPVYRGFIGQRGKGLSWTTDREKAVWFAERFACLEELGRPRLVSGHAVKKDVLAYFTRREEAEIVIDPTKVKRQTTVMI
jgi:hypothetical protein